MSIVAKLSQAVEGAVKSLYGAEVSAEQIQLQKCKREFEGHLTLVTFPLLKVSRKKPEVTAEEIGAFLKENEAMVEAVQVIKGFLNL